MFKKIITAAAIGLAAFGAQASANLLANGGLENASIDGGDFCYSALSTNCSATGWSADLLISSTSGAWGNPSAQAGSIDIGNVVAGLQDDRTLTSNFALVAGQTYTLTWDDANRTGYYYGAYGDPETYNVEVAGSTVGTYTVSTNVWAAHSLTFTAAEDGLLSFNGQYLTYDGTAFIDNVSLSAVPEPANVALMLMGALGLVAWRRRSQV